MHENTWLHIHTAALRGLPAALVGDQALVHCLEPRADKKGQAHADCRKRVAVGVHGEHCGGDGEQVKRAECETFGHGSSNLFQLVHAQDAIKATRVSFELSLGQLLDLQLARVRNDPGPHPVTDGALIAAQRASRQLLVAVVAGNLFGCHGYGLWHLPYGTCHE